MISQYRIWRGEIARAREQLLVEKPFSRTDRLIRGGAVKRAFFVLLAFFVVGSALGQSPAKVRITTWNLEWFPNGSPREATPEKQAQRIQAAADVLKTLNPDILLLQEVRDYDACARLGNAIQPGAYTVGICSAFNGGKQQEAILAKIPAQAAWSESWKSMEGIDPPRGFAFAWFKIGNADIGVYSLHLKSNLITHGDKEAETAKNIRKREIAIAQLVTHIHDVIGATIPTIKGIVIGGDFNTNHDQPMFGTERTLDSLADAGYQNGFEGLALAERVTHPGTHGFPDATFDFIFAKNLTALQPTITRTNASDHWPVTRSFALHSVGR
jgi:endonuclease/exonuclease/phosphatase family metal-dependent hydrolase